MTKKRMLFWFLLVAFSAGTIFWFFHVPYRPADLYRVVPANATFVSHHRVLAERWDDFSANPLARALFISMGLDLEDMGEWSADPATRVWLDKLLARDLLIAHVPEIGPGRDPAWVLTGWIGGESIRLRWLLTRGKLEGFERFERVVGRPYWLVDTDDESEEHLSISIVDGMLIGVFSRDPHAVRSVLDVYDGLVPRHPLVRADAWTSIRSTEESVPDRGWFVAPNEAGTPTTYFFDFTEVDQAGIRGSLRRQEVGALPVMKTTNIEVPSRLLGGVPFCLVGMNPEAGVALWLDLLPLVLQEVVQGVFATDAVELLLLAVMGGEYAGTLSGVSVPALMAAWPVADEAAALEGVRALLDRLNAIFRWGLVVTETQVDERPVYVIESTANTVYTAFRFRERIAFTLVDGWMVVSSHAFPLMRILGRYDRPEAIFEADQGGWQSEVRRGDAAAYGYLNLQSGARTLRLAISAWSVKLLFDDPKGSRETRQQLNEIRAWVDTLEPMGAAHLWLNRNDDWLTLRFALGEKGKDDQ